MGVPNSQKYTVSKHAAMRIRTRFNIPATKIQGWINRFMGEASFFKDGSGGEDGERRIYKKDDVLLVLNIDSYIVVTAYQYNPMNKTDGLSADVLDLLGPSLKEIAKQQRITLRDSLDGLMMDLQFDYQAFQSHPKSDKYFEKYLAKIDEINKQIAQSQSVIRDIDALKQ